MVSSYNIFTNIVIPLKYVKLFNKFSTNFHPYLSPESVKVQSYYDAGYYDVPKNYYGMPINIDISYHI